MKLMLTTLLSLAFALLAHAQEPIFSNSFTTDSTLEGGFIRESFTTLILPELNSPIGDSFLKIYPALYTNGTASLSGTALTIAEGSPCGDSTEEWCVGARLVVNNTQNSAPYVLTPPGTHLDIHHKYDDAAGKYEQSISIDGNVVSILPVDDELSLDVGVAVQWTTHIECQRAGCGTISSHRYINTRIVLNFPDPEFGKWTGTDGASGGTPSSNDGGVTWEFEDIVINSFTWT